MKVRELRQALQFAREDDDVFILLKSKGSFLGGARHMVPIESVSSGFDWEHGRFIIKPSKNLKEEE
jgi:hypothetical protein